MNLFPARRARLLLNLHLVIGCMICNVIDVAWGVADRPSEPIVNSAKGLWDDGSDSTLVLVPDLVIGKADGDSHEVLGRVGDVAVGPGGDIYVLDTGFRRILQYDEEGNYKQMVGRQGEGPGEFSYPTALAVSGSGTLYVGDGRFVKVLTSDGVQSDMFRSAGADGFIQSIRIDQESGWTYVSSYDALQQKLVHVYDHSNQYLFSFCDSWAKGTDMDVRVEGAAAGGRIDITRDALIYFTQLTPYEVRIFDASGKLRSVIRRDSSFLLAPAIKYGVDGMQVTLRGAAAGIVVLADGKFLNIARPAPADNGEDETVIDLFDSTGRLLTSRRFLHFVGLKRLDAEGRVLSANTGEFPTVVRYRVSYKAED